MYERTREQSISYVGSQENSHSLQIGAMTLATTATVIMFGYTEKYYAERINSGCTQLSLR